LIDVPWFMAHPARASTTTKTKVQSFFMIKLLLRQVMNNDELTRRETVGVELFVNPMPGHGTRLESPNLQ
jgi:hypothetical protein